ncbi:hypothetical protein BDD12DRAFT_896519, partial [Trichophaea hybrida]
MPSSKYTTKCSARTDSISAEDTANESSDLTELDSAEDKEIHKEEEEEEEHNDKDENEEDVPVSNDDMEHMRRGGGESPSPRALRSVRSKKKLAAEERRETHFISNQAKDKCLKDYVERETTGATKRVEDAEAAVQQKQDDTRKDENVGLTNRAPEKTFQEMMVDIGDSLSDHASSDNGRMGKKRMKTPEQSQLKEDDESGW